MNKITDTFEMVDELRCSSEVVKTMEKPCLNSLKELKRSGS